MKHHCDRHAVTYVYNPEQACFKCPWRSNCARGFTTKDDRDQHSRNCVYNPKKVCCASGFTTKSGGAIHSMICAYNVLGLWWCPWWYKCGWEFTTKRECDFHAGTCAYNPQKEGHRCEDGAAHSCLCLGLGQTIGCVLLQVSPCVSTLGDPFGISIYSRSVLYTVYESGARRSTGGRIQNYSRVAVLRYRSSHRRSHLQHDSKQRHWALRTRVARARNLAPRRNQSQRDEARNEGPLVHQ